MNLNDTYVRLPTIVESLLTLTGAGLEDGEEARSYDSEYVAVSCLVTSDSGGMSLSAGEGKQHVLNCFWVTIVGCYRATGFLVTWGSVASS